MTDEEMAEQFNKDNCIWWEYDSLSGDEEMADKYIKDNCERWECDCLPVDDIAKESFLAGLKAGKPQWHDLRENPNDLPKDKEYVLVYTNLTNYYVAEKVDDHFMSKGWGFIPMSTVIAWCEIPTFDKE